MTNAAQKMMGGWDHRIDAAAEMTRLTLDVATDALFHAHVGGEPTTIARAVSTLLAEINYRFQVPFYPPISVPTPRNRRMRQAIRTLDRAMYGIIEQRRRDGEEGDDLLSMLMAARDEETGAAMSDRQLRDEVITLFIAGHDTTANALTWTFYLLAKYPEADERLRAELDEVLDGAVPTVTDLPKLPYGRMVIEEAMRLYPPAWITDRQAVKEDEILGHRIPAGGHVIISPYVTHRLPTLWENPENFDPDRFSPEQVSTRPRYAYFPFGGGPRQCIGKGMALMEAHLILASVIQRYRLRLATDQPVQSQPTVTLRPRGGLPMTVEPVS
jgi:cytochrome P450